MWGRSKDKPKQKKIIVETCPQCGSRKIEHKMGLTVFVMAGIVYSYQCPDCGYKGITVHLTELDPDEVQRPEKEGQAE